MLRKKEAEGALHGFSVASQAPIVSHLFFADDCYLFFRANSEECMIVQHILNAYGNVSGQVINFNKSSVMFSSNVSEDMRTFIFSFLNVPQV